MPKQPNEKEGGNRPPSKAADQISDAIDLQRVQRLRDEAADLRSLVSQGTYDDKELKEFWRLTQIAGMILLTSNPDLAARAGLGDSFFLSVSRDRRRPKLSNFLKALTAIIDTADERLRRSDATGATVSRTLQADASTSNFRIKTDHRELLLLASSLSELARREIEKIDSERPNDPVTIESNKKQRELLTIFADGFERIASALGSLTNNPNKPLLVRKASDITSSVGREINSWWRKNSAEAMDWSVRLPVFAAGVAMLGWAGANMTVATSAVAALVGGSKVLEAIKHKRKLK